MRVRVCARTRKSSLVKVSRVSPNPTVSYLSTVFPDPPARHAVIATKGRETDYEGVKDDMMKVLAELNVMIARAATM